MQLAKPEREQALYLSVRLLRGEVPLESNDLAYLVWALLIEGKDIQGSISQLGYSRYRRLMRKGEKAILGPVRVER